MKSSSWFAVVALTALNAVACSGADPSIDLGDEADITAAGARFETFGGIDGQTYFHLVAGNGELVLQSEGYERSNGATVGIQSVKANGKVGANYHLMEAKDGSFYFNLVSADNHKVIATSEMYTKKSNAEKGAANVVRLVNKINRWEAVAAQPKATFNVFKGMDGQYYFNLRAKNGEIVLQSEGYTSKQNAVKGIDSVVNNGTVAEGSTIFARRSDGAVGGSFTVFEGAGGQFAFHIRATNGEIIAHGETYSKKSNAERAVKTVLELLGTSVPVNK